MRHFYSLLFLFLFIAFGFSLHAQQAPSAKPVYMIVHGAWGGSWAYRKVDSLMTERGCIVYRPALTGQGEKVHLASLQVGLNTHINDVVNQILYEDLHDVILIGHSYGGMVVTGVADSVPGRIRKLIYLDAFVPDNGESLMSIRGIPGESVNLIAPNGFVVPSWVQAGKLPPKDVPHPVKTWTDTLILRSAFRQKIPTTYIVTVEKGKKPENDDFASQAERARKKEWPVLQLEADHNPQWSAPDALVEILMQVGSKR